MKRPLVECGLVLLLVSAAFAPVRATDVPSVALYFDRALTRQHTVCPDSPPGTVVDTLFVAASGFAEPIEGIEFTILFPPEVTWLGDIYPDNGLRIGVPVTGFSLAFFAPLDASSPVIIQEHIVVWMCEGCMTATDIPIELTSHPVTGSLRAVTSDLVFEDAVGDTSWVCPLLRGSSPARTTTASGSVSAVSMSAQCVLDCPAGDGGVILPGDPPGEHHTPDLDNDGLVSIEDFAEFGTSYLISFDPDEDFYCSGDIDLIDFVLFTRHWLHSGSVSIEPSTWGNIKARYED